MTARPFPELRVGSLVRVRWDDASSHDEGWSDLKDIVNRVQACDTSGWVVKRDRKQIVLAMSKGTSGAQVQYATTWAIPIGWIKSVERWP